MVENKNRNKKRVLLIFPPNVNIIEPFLSSKKKQPPLLPGFPLGLGYLASYLLKEGDYEIKIIDGYKDNLSIDDICGIIRDFDPNYIGMTVYTINSKVAVKIAEMIKANFKNKIVIAGGPHASDSFDSLLKRYPFFDFVVVGEGEKALLELLRALDRNDYGSLGEIKGIAYREALNGALVYTGDRAYLKDIDQFPPPARELVDFDSYIIRDNRLPYAVEIMGSRGCSNRCIFCSSQKPWRARNILEIINEMKYLIKRYPKVKGFMFFDDNFSVDKERVIELCKAIIREGLNKYMWSCLSRVDQITEETISWMKKAGCTKVMYGIETADSDIMKNLNKKISLSQVEYAIGLTTKLGIDTLAFFIIGSPGETVETIKKSYNLAKKLKCHSTIWSIMQVYPGTALAKLQPCDDFVEFLYSPEIENPCVMLSANIPVFENQGLNREQLKVIYENVFRRIVLIKALQNPLFILKKIYRTPILALRFLANILKRNH